jgi:O-antigen/teichoic acid export membrane protein
MGVVFRQSAKNSIVVATGALLGLLVMWLSTNYIPKQELGFINTLTNYAVTLAQILLLGLNSTMAVYIHRYAEDLRKKKLLLTFCFGVPLVIALLSTVVYFLLKPWILHHFQPADVPLMSRYFMWIPIYTVLFIYMVLLEQYLGSQLRVAVSAFMREVVLRVANIALILLFVFGYISFHILVISTVLVYFLPLAIFYFLSLRTKAFGFSLKLADFSKREYKEMAHFSWYHFLMVVSVILLGSMDSMVIPLYDHKGFSSMAVYRVATLLISFLLVPMKAMLPASFAVLAKAFADNDIAKAKDIFSRATINVFIPMVAIVALIFCNLGNAVLIIGKGYAEVVPLFMILSMGNIVHTMFGMADQVLSVTNYYKFSFYISMALMVVLFFLLRTFIPLYGVYGAAWCTSLSIVVFTIAKYVFVRKKLGMNALSSNTFLVLISGIAAMAAGYAFPHFLDQSRHVYVRTFADVAMRSTVVAVVYVAMLLWLKPSKDLQEYLASIKRNKRLF